MSFSPGQVAMRSLPTSTCELKHIPSLRCSVLWRPRLAVGVKELLRPAGQLASPDSTSEAHFKREHWS